MDYYRKIIIGIVRNEQIVFSEYFNSKDLHIGITTSTGIIIEFDRKGLQKKGLHWDQCLLIGQLPTSWSDHWDDTLLKVSIL